MNRLTASLAAVAAATLMQDARAGDRELVEEAYTQVFNRTGAPDLAQHMNRIFAPRWASIGDYSGAAKSREQLLPQLQGFARLIPDLSWKIEEIVQVGNRFVVRGRASGTPVGTFFGVPASGRRFEIMSIDMHTVEAGQIVTTYHIEDWAGALRQLSAK
jgi:predicted ester cyclase